jgi:hypothetical protein
MKAMSRYVLWDPAGGRWYYNISVGVTSTLLFDGHQAQSTTVPDWWVADHKVSVAEVVWPGRTETIGYRLRDPDAASPRFPVELSVEQFKSRTHDDVGDLRDDSAEWALYEEVSRPGSEWREPLDLSALIDLDGTPPPPHAGTWIAELPYALSQYPCYRHLFPGELHGYGEALKVHLKGLPYVKHAFLGVPAHGHYRQRDVLEIVVEVPYEPAMVETQPATNRNGTPSRTKRVRVERKFRDRVTVLAPESIPGATLAEAVGTWDRKWAEAVAAVEALTALKRCPHCLGTGVAGSGSQEVSGE